MMGGIRTSSALKEQVCGCKSRDGEEVDGEKSQENQEELRREKEQLDVKLFKRVFSEF
jgi:hypothetical protein